MGNPPATGRVSKYVLVMLGFDDFGINLIKLLNKPLSYLFFAI